MSVRRRGSVRLCSGWRGLQRINTYYSRTRRLAALQSGRVDVCYNPALIWAVSSAPLSTEISSSPLVLTRYHSNMIRMTGKKTHEQGNSTSNWSVSLSFSRILKCTQGMWRNRYGAVWKGNTCLLITFIIIIFNSNTKRFAQNWISPQMTKSLMCRSVL